LAVFGHGLLGSIEQIDQHLGPLEALDALVRLLVFDARGHGQSEGPDSSAEYTWESLGRDMVAFADHLGAETAVFGGASMGAASALWAGIERPERVRALVLVMPPPLGPLEIRGPDERQAVAALDFVSSAVQAYGLEKTAELVKSIPGLAGDPEERAAWVRSQSPRALAFAIQGLIRAPFHDPEAYRCVTAPTLVIAHENDGLHPVRAAQLLKEKIPNCRLAVAPSLDHWRSHPEEFIAELQAFRDAVA
jgi:pimeloyl-ACP methyl ester carboxylesterase